MATKISLKEKFHGALVGAVIGDCLGALFEFSTHYDGIKREKILRKLDPRSNKFSKNKTLFKYTDDTAMALSVCDSLLKHEKYDAVHMATCFTKEYISSPNRGYGGGIKDIFYKWNNGTITKENVYIPSREQFDSIGSYGNGAAMRVSPVALFAQTEDECVNVAKETAALTHSHKYGINGAILQALGVYKVLHCNKIIDPRDFVENLKVQMRSLEKETEKDKHYLQKKCGKEAEDLTVHEALYEYTRSSKFSYVNQLDAINKLLCEHNSNKEFDDTAKVIETLGCDVTAQQAVPTALYCFLRNIEKGFEETLYYSISIGGDTDTISTMSCAMAGAYYGLSAIPVEWINCCESTLKMKTNAEEFFTRLKRK